MSLDAKRTRNDPRRDRTHRRLLDACGEILRESGIAGLTTVEVTRRAGVSQPTFYRHFKNMDECLVATAEEIVTKVQRGSVTLHRSMIFENPPLDVVATGLQVIYQMILAEGAFAEIFVRYRATLSPLGKTAALIPKRAQFEVREGFIELAREMGIDSRFDADVELIADLCVMATLSGLEILVLNPHQRPADVASRVAQQLLGLSNPAMAAMRQRSLERRARAETN